MIHVAHLSGAKRWRGAEQQIWYLVQANTQQVSNFLFCPEDSALHQKAGKLENHTGTYTKYAGFDIAGAWKLKRFVQQHRIGLLHIHDSHALNLYWIARLFGMKTPAVLTRHVNFRPGNPYKYRGKHIRRIICVSEAVQHTMAEITDPDKLIVIHPGIEIIATKEISGLRKKYGIDPASFIIGTVCALEKEKDLPAFIRIIQGLIPLHPTLHALIVGEGSQRKALEDQIRAAGLENHIHLTGFRSDVADCLSEMAVFLFTSTSEGFPLAPAEAMLAHIPVVARSGHGIDELFINETSGLFYSDEADAIAKCHELLRDAPYRNHIAQQGHGRAQQFSVAHLIEKTHTLYSEILP